MSSACHRAGHRPGGQERRTFFNKSLRMAPLQPIPEEESTPSRLEGRPPACARRGRGCRHLGTVQRAGLRRERHAYSADQKHAGMARELREFLAACPSAESAPEGNPPPPILPHEIDAYSELLNLVFNGAIGNGAARHARLPEAEPVSTGEPPGVVLRSTD